MARLICACNAPTNSLKAASPRRAVSSVGRAPRLHRGCREFESLTAHHFIKTIQRFSCKKYKLAMMARRDAAYLAPIALRLEHLPPAAWPACPGALTAAAGAIPSGPASHSRCAFIYLHPPEGSHCASEPPGKRQAHQCAEARSLCAPARADPTRPGPARPVESIHRIDARATGQIRLIGRVSKKRHTSWFSVLDFTVCAPYISATSRRQQIADGSGCSSVG